MLLTMFLTMFCVFILKKFVFRTAGRSDHRVPGRVHQQGGAGDDCRLSGGLAQVPYTQYHLSSWSSVVESVQSWPASSLDKRSFLHKFK